MYLGKQKESFVRIFILASSLLVLILFISTTRFFDKTPNASLKTPNTRDTQTDVSFYPFIKIRDVHIPIETATTTAAVQKGLSGRLSLAQDRGMLFIFAQPDYYRFWMPDMHFPIDIIWIAENAVSGITADISPVFDPYNPRFYVPPQPVQYVLEVNAGFAKQHNINKGDTVTFHYSKPLWK